MHHLDLKDIDKLKVNKENPEFHEQNLNKVYKVQKGDNTCVGDILKSSLAGITETGLLNKN